MAEPNPVFQKNYGDYLRQLDNTNMSLWESVLDITVDEKRRTAQIPFFHTLYRVSPFGVVNDRGRRPDYGTCVNIAEVPADVPATGSVREGLDKLS